MAAGGDTASLVVALSAQVSKFEKDMKDAVKVADTNVKAIETRFSQMNDKISQEFSGFVSRYAAAAGPLGGVLSALGPVGVTVAAGIGAAAIALSFLSQKTDEYIQKQRDLKEASETTGLTIGQLQELKRASRETGVEFDRAVAGVTRMLVQIQQLREKGTGPLAESLDKIKEGLADQIIASKSPAEAVDLLAKVLEDASNNFQKAGLAADTFGKRGLENIRVLQATLKRGGLNVAPDITDEEKAFNDKLIALDNQVKSAQKNVGDTLGKLFSEKMRSDQLQFWQVMQSGASGAEAATKWFGNFLQQVKDYVAAKEGVKSTNEELSNLKMPGVGAGGPQPRSTTGVSGAAGSTAVITDPYATTKVQFDVTAQMKSLQAAMDEAIKSTNESLGEQDAMLKRNLDFVNRWAGVLGDAIKPQEQLYIQQLKVNDAVRQYEPGSSKAIALQEAGNRATERLVATQTIAANNLRERLLLLSEEEIVQNKLAQARLDAEKAGIRNIDLTKEEIVIRKQAKETIEQQAAATSKLPETVRAGQQAMNQFKQLDQFLVSSASNFENAFADIASGSKTAADAFKSLADSIIKDLIRITLRLTVTGPLMSALGSAFGAPAQGSSSIFSSVFPTFGGTRQGGGPVSSGRGYIVGEHGTELFVPSQSGMIVPNLQSAQQGGDLKVTVNNYTSGQTETTQERRSGPTGEELIIGIVKRTIASGGVDDANRSRFGLRTAKVR